MKVATRQIMRSIDNYCIDTLKIPGVVLMENAALKVIENINLDKYKSFVVVCGKGNNGGDGFAVARHLLIMGKTVEVFLVGTEDGLSADCKINHDILKNMGVVINRLSNVEDANEFRESLNRCEVTLDAIFGTGLSKNVEGEYDMIISLMNENSSYIISIDVPSGFDSDSGRILGNCIRANKTISFQLYKRGFLNYGTDKFTGEVIVEDIGIPQFVVNKFHENEFIMDREMVKEHLVTRNKYAHKGDYGRVLVVAGSKGFTGAAYIATQGAVKSGAGLVTLCCREDIIEVLSSKLVEAMTIGFEDKEKVNKLIERCNSIAVGPGMGVCNSTYEMVTNIIYKAKCPLVIDADGINVLKDNLEVLKKKNNDIVITPHVGEMSTITGMPIEYIQENRIQVAKKFAKDYGVIVLLKGYNTIITNGEITIINPTGNSSMASGGMGDCLTGMVASLIGQGYEPMEAACIGTFVHGYCGERLSEKMFCVDASHIIDKIPFIIKELYK